MRCDQLEENALKVEDGMEEKVKKLLDKWKKELVTMEYCKHGYDELDDCIDELEKLYEEAKAD